MSTVLAVFGVVYVPSDAVKAAVAAAAGLVLAVWQWQHHQTTRHADALAADLARDRANRTAAVAAAVTKPAPAPVAPPVAPTVAPSPVPPAGG